ncbi:unnamed protein product [Litomosoides sigmodontis]|uniref:CHCH domain-containing protein n=1 Tax=Litomosoides sigmodontis TaxID=42156 RepID=A0A3P6UAB0_LITSI|nr:unnamed protein product [Litomosoides sigmodontis]
MKCQKSAGEGELEEGACATEFMNFMKCVIRTECFKSRRDISDDDDDEGREQKNDELKDSVNSDETS